MSSEINKCDNKNGFLCFLAKVKGLTSHIHGVSMQKHILVEGPKVATKIVKSVLSFWKCTLDLNNKAK